MPCNAIRSCAASAFAILALGSALALAGPTLAQPTDDAAPVVENVVLVTLDGVRWQEIFSGADERLMVREAGVSDPESLQQHFWRESPEQRRRLLAPFLWTQVAENGVLLGDHQEEPGSPVVSNEIRISYPGYSELLTGIVDPQIRSNNKTPNPNTSVLEWAASQPGFEQKVAAFTSWDVFPYILNVDRSAIPINAGWQAYQPTTMASSSTISSRPESLSLLNRLQGHSYREWPGVRFDTFTHTFALDYLEHYQPRLFYVALGEPDDWAHSKQYGHYLDAIQRNDTMLQELWSRLQELDAYRDKTLLLITTDHGRGRTLEDWSDHGPNVEGCEETWLAALGPGIEPRRTHRPGERLTLAQVASTIAEALGLDYDVDAVAPAIDLWATVQP